MKLQLDDGEQHRYLRVYNYYRELIEKEQLGKGTRLPSIRKCSVQLHMSRTTVETAYMMLAAEGYIISKPQSGFYVAQILRPGRPEPYEHQTGSRNEPALRYDFAASNVDRNSFQFDLWRRYIKSALRQDERLLSYGVPQGETELREALCDYLVKYRNVVCSPEHIVVGAGVQSLLHILCPMVKAHSKVRLYNPDFQQGRTMFEDYGFDIIGGEERTVKGEEFLSNSLFYLTPSQMTAWGEVMHISERLKLIREAFEKNVLIIEDDYNSEFRYYNRPTPSLQGLSGGRNVVYLGTFSRLLLPSIRMSFMVLPPELLEGYKKRGMYYNQTASKAEQIAMAQFIRDGHLESQIRKTRKLYSAKAKRLEEEIKAVFGEQAVTYLGEAGFLVLAEFRTNLSSAQIEARAKKAGIAVRPLEEKGESGYPRILFSCSTVETECYREALTVFQKAVFL